MTYFVKYQIGEQQRRISLGTAAPGTLADMRRKASDVRARAKLGQDVQGERRAAFAEAVSTAPVGLSLKKAIGLYLADRLPVMKPRYGLEVERHLNQDWKDLHGMAVADITRHHVIAGVDAIAARGRVAADRARSSLGTLFIWLIDRGHLDDTPVRHIKPRSQSNGGRERTLTEAELRAIWHGTAPASDYHRIVRLLLLSGSRRDEIGSLRWAEVNMTESQIELPGERTKNARPHIIPLSPLAIEQLPPYPMARAYVFGRKAGAGFSGWSKAKRELGEALGGDFAAWRLHDLRRTVVTMMNERGIAPPHVIEAVVNHVSGSRGGVAGVYNRASYSSEKRAALLAWSEYVETIVE
jgi:integrase